MNEPDSTVSTIDKACAKFFERHQFHENYLRIIPHFWYTRLSYKYGRGTPEQLREYHYVVNLHAHVGRGYLACFSVNFMPKGLAETVGAFLSNKIDPLASLSTSFDPRQPMRTLIIHHYSQQFMEKMAVDPKILCMNGYQLKGYMKEIGL